MSGATDERTQTCDERASDDRTLVRRFAKAADEEAFAALVRRHGPMVMGVCRRLLHNQQHAEDAFQATFLVLAQKAGRVRWRRSLANWLHTVAFGVCQNARRRIARRRETELTMDAQLLDEALAPIAATDQPLELLARREELLVFDEELAALPDRYRAPLVLFYLEGQSRQEVAETLGLTLAAVKTRLERGRRQLRMRLVLRGVALSSAVLLLQHSQPAAASAVSDWLVSVTAASATSITSGAPAGMGVYPADEVISLTEGQLSMMTWTTYSTKGMLAVTGLATAVLLTAALGGHAADNDNPVGDSTEAPASKTDVDPFASPPALESSEPATADSSDPLSDETVIVAKSTPSAPAPARRSKSTGRAGHSGGSFTPEMSPQEEKTLAALDEETQFDFVDEELERVAAYLGDLHGINIVLDRKALEDAGTGVDTPVRGSIHDARLRYGLRMLLRGLDLVSTVADDALVITTKQGLPSYTRIRTYRITEITNADWDADEVIEMLCSMFDDIDEETVVGHGDHLVVRATIETQQQIEQVLDELMTE